MFAAFVARGINVSMDLPTFKEQCERFLSVSDRIKDGWTIIQANSLSTCDFYLKKRISRILNVETSNSNPEECEPGNEPEITDFEDPSSEDTSNFPETVTWEYHVIFSESYGVPVLYFNCWKNDGSILRYEEILSWLHSEMKSQLIENRWQSITQQEHPVLGRPFYMLHPCKTAEYLNLIQKESSVNPLVSWLSSFGGAIGLNIPLNYGVSPLVGEQ